MRQHVADSPLKSPALSSCACIAGRAGRHWESEPGRAAATLDSFRDTLEDQGNGLGLTDPVSGNVVMALK